MNDLEPILRRVAAINPVPDETDLPANSTSTTALLDVIDERTGTLKTQHSTKKPTEEPKRKHAGALIVLATFVIVMAIGGAMALSGGQGDETSSAAAIRPATNAVSVIPASDVFSRSNSKSMENTIYLGALLTIDRTAYDSNMPQRLDIVLHAAMRDSDVTEPQEFVARVIGLPGETIEVRDGDLYVDNRKLDEPYLKNPQIPEPAFGPVTLGADELWLMGDNRQASHASEVVGAIPVAWLRARVTQIANP